MPSFDPSVASAWLVFAGLACAAAGAVIEFVRRKVVRPLLELAEIREHFQPNGGASLLDKVNGAHAAAQDAASTALQTQQELRRHTEKSDREHRDIFGRVGRLEDADVHLRRELQQMAQQQQGGE